jgi:putative membrane protein
MADSGTPVTASATASAAKELVPTDLLSAQMSWIRSDLSNLRTLLSWVRTSVSMIGFDFTIYNFYSIFFEEFAGERFRDAARNLGLALVIFGTLAMIIAMWNFWSINEFLKASQLALPVPPSLKMRWYFSYITATVVLIIGLVTFLFMIRVL